MKLILLSLAIALLMVGWGKSSLPSESVDMNDTALKKDAIETAVEWSKLEVRNGIRYLQNEETPFTGRAKQFYFNGQKSGEVSFKDGKGDGLATTWYENGQKKREGNLKDDKPDGLATEWYENGQKKSEVNFKDGRRNGLYTSWHENGQQSSEVNFKDGKQNGLYTSWHENGQQSSEVNCKDGKLDGLETRWYENGQKAMEINYKDGKEDGLKTMWYENNGQKEEEANWKDGKLMSAVRWKPNGEKCPVTNVKDGNGVVVRYNEDTDLIKMGLREVEFARFTYKDGRRIYPELSPASQQDATERNQGGSRVSNENKPDVVKLIPQDVFGGKFHEVKRKLENGADPDAILLPKGKRTALHCCCMGGRVNIVKLLLAGGASPNALDKYNMTPLDILFSPDEKGRAPLERMSAENQLEIQKMLEKAGGKRNRLPSKELFKGKYINDTAPKKDAIETADWSKLQDRSGVTYLPNTDKPFSGSAKRVYENEQIEVLAQFKYGYVVRVKQWQENGTPRWDLGFMEGKVAKSDVQLEDWSDANANFSHNDGLSTIWYENGQKAMEINFKDGKLMSAEVWKPNGEKCPVTNIDKDGNGLLTVWFENGQKAEEGNFKDGKPNGLITVWFENGQKEVQETYKDGEPDGIWTGWYENGQKRGEGTYKDGKLDGLWTEWYENGQKMKEGRMKDGKNHGLETHWYENGQKKGEGRMKDGKLMEAVQWKPNGEKCPVTNLKDGIGVVVWYREDGTVSRRDSWKDGKLDGISIYYNEDGTEWYRTTYKDGVEVED